MRERARASDSAGVAWAVVRRPRRRVNRLRLLHEGCSTRECAFGRAIHLIHRSNPSMCVNTTGITRRLNAVDVGSPPMTATPIGFRKLASAPKPIAMGSMPAIIATVVITMGRARS